MSIFNEMKSFLFGGEQAAGHAHPPTNSLKVTAATPRLSAKIQAGNLQMIGLQAIRDALGDDWPKRREAINRIVDGVIRKHLGASDAHYHLDNDEYLVLFVQLNHAQARNRAAAIAAEAERLILGELPEHDIRLASTVAEIDSDFVTSKVGSLEDLVAHVKSTGQSGAAASMSGELGDVLLFGDDDGCTGKDDTIASAPRSNPVMGAGPDLADLDQSLDCLFQKKTSAAFLKECQAAFYPNFSTKRRNFAFYTVHVTHTPTGRTADTSDPMLEDPEELSFLLDRYRLTTALLGLHRMVTGGHTGLISIPVSFATLAAARTRNVYLNRFKDLPAGLFRSLCLIITDIPDGTPASRISDAMNYIQRFCSSRILHIAPDVRLIDLYAATGCQGFSMALPVAAADQAARLQVLSAFAKRATWHKMEAILWNVASTEDISLGTAAGFSFLAGDAVAPQILTPGHRQALRADHIPPRAVAAPAKVA